MEQVNYTFIQLYGTISQIRRKNKIHRHTKVKALGLLGKNKIQVTH